MTLILELTPEQEAELQAQADRKGLPLHDFALQRLVGMPRISGSGMDAENTALLRLLQEWDEEDGAMTEEEVAQEAASWEQIKSNLNAARAAGGERQLFT